ncbi:MAG: glycosyltransferase family 39 protein [Candidatus Methanoperedens sp.]|nr:glycosyltransferase family 39 protein [Candidatus Methanoperedens sp.]MCZ7371220.1 glycosyltransferase family 39 protein [Candidatus Methanoperedens sp.]
MKKRWLIALIATYIVVRTCIATFSSYGYYHGWNEGYYSLIAKNYFSGSLWEQIAYPGGEPFSSAPPLFSYAVYTSFKIFGISDISARLVSILSELIAVLGVYILARELHNERTASIAAIIFIFIPWNILWFGRVETDPLMTALMTLAIALYVRAYKKDESMLPFGIMLGLAVFTKQPALAALPIVLIWSYFQGIKKKQVINAFVCFLVGMVPLLVWLSYYFINGNTAFVSHFIYGELVYRSEPFSDLGRVVLFTAAGITPIIIAATYQMFKERDVKNILAIWLLIYGAFVLIRTPPSHEYYSLPLMAPLAIMAAAGIAGFSHKLDKKFALIPLAVVIILAVPITYALFVYSGDLGYTATKDAGEFLKVYMDKHPDGDYLVLVQMKYSPQIAWYADLRVDGKRQIYSTGDDLSVPYLTGVLNNFDPAKTVLLVSDFEKNTGKASINYDVLYESRYESAIANLDILYNLGTSYGLKIVRVR